MSDATSIGSGLGIIAGLAAALIVWIDRTFDRNSPRSDWLERCAGKVLIALAALPFAWLTSFAVVAGVARAQLGRWPELVSPRPSWLPDNGAPTRLESDSLGAPFLLSLALLFPAFLSLAAYVPLAWRTHVEGIGGLRRTHVSFAFGYLALLALWWSDPRGVIRWWLD